MTHYEQRLVEAAFEQVRGLTTKQAVARLFAAGFLDLNACERQIILSEVERAEARGARRCEAMHAAARNCSCSYEKVRTIYYNQFKKPKK